MGGCRTLRVRSVLCLLVTKPRPSKNVCSQPIYSMRVTCVCPSPSSPGLTAALPSPYWYNIHVPRKPRAADRELRLSMTAAPIHAGAPASCIGSDHSVLSFGAESTTSSCSRDLLGWPGSCMGHGIQENDLLTNSSVLKSSPLGTDPAPNTPRPAPAPRPCAGGRSGSAAGNAVPALSNPHQGAEADCGSTIAHSISIPNASSCPCQAKPCGT